MNVSYVMIIIENSDDTSAYLINLMLIVVGPELVSLSKNYVDVS